uniref:MD domain-containing protein n=1 Tax=Panagrolaimus sp. ES5 TaxID=591445 RepID=A0AC34GXZ6_9BILA
MKECLCLFVLLVLFASCHAVAIKSNKSDITCPIGYIGEKCKASVCSRTDPKNLSSNGQSLTFIVHNSMTTVTMIQKMQFKMSKVINDMITQNPKWIITYNLVNFTGQEMELSVQTNDPNVFLERFKEFAAENEANTPKYSCKELPVLDALNVYLSAIGKPPAPNSNIFIFMNGIIRYQPALFQAVRDIIIQDQVKISFIEVSAYPCGESITSSGASLMWNISSLSGGEVYAISDVNVPALLKTFPSQYKNAMTSEAHFEDCSKEQIFKFPVDSQTKIVNILINGSLVETPKYINPDGNDNDLSVTNVYSDFSTNSRFDQVIHSIVPGFWAIKLQTSQGSCSIKVSSQSNIFVYPIFVRDEDDDIGPITPFLSVQQYLIAHVDGLSSFNGTKNGSLHSVTISSNETSFTLKMHLRDPQTCKHEYISSSTFHCPPGNYKMTFTGIDSNGFDFQHVQRTGC